MLHSIAIFIYNKGNLEKSDPSPLSLPTPLSKLVPVAGSKNRLNKSSKVLANTLQRERERGIAVPQVHVLCMYLAIFSMAGAVYNYMLYMYTLPPHLPSWRICTYAGLFGSALPGDASISHVYAALYARNVLLLQLYIRYVYVYIYIFLLRFLCLPRKCKCYLLNFSASAHFRLLNVL